MRTGILKARLDRIESASTLGRIVALVDVPESFISDPRLQERLEQAARRGIPEDERPQGTTIIALQSGRCRGDISEPVLSEWFRSELTHEEALEFMK